MTLCVACKRTPTDGGLQCAACLAGKSPRQAAGSGGDASRACALALETQMTGVRTRNPARADVSEADEQEEIVNLLELHGFAVWRVGQRDARGTQDPGVPDLIALSPRWGLAFVEAKRPDRGVQSDDQVTFAQQCRAARVPYVCGALPAVQTFLAGLTRPL